MRLPDLDDADLIADVYVSYTAYTAGSLDDLLRAVADAEAFGVIIADEDLRWLYHPYDGGADVILPTTPERDRLKDRHRDWLSIHPTGL
jgi:hypothetical protein